MSIRLFLLLLMMMWGCEAANASWWMPPPREHWSPDGRYLLRVDGWPEPVTFTSKQKNANGGEELVVVPIPEHAPVPGDPGRPIKLTLKRRSANGFLKLWSAKSPQRFPPATVHFSDDGQYVILQDEWFGMEDGWALVFIGGNGRVLAKYRLRDVLPESELIYAPSWIGADKWTYGSSVFFRDNKREFALLTCQGTTRCFDLASGRLVPLSDGSKTAIQEEARDRARIGLRDSDWETRRDSAIVLGVVADTDSVDILRKLLDDDPKRQEITFISDAGEELFSYYPVRLGAGRALAAILGDHAAMLIANAARSAGDDRTDTSKWLDVLEECKGPQSVEAWREFLNHQDQYIRREAVEAVSELDGGATVRAHPELLRDSSGEVRCAAVRALSVSPVPGDERALAAALADSDETAVWFAIQGLDRLGPADLDSILTPARTHRSGEVRRYWQIALARHGDPAEMKALLAIVTRLGERYVNGSDEYDPYWFADVCKMLATTNPTGAEAALREAARCHLAAYRIPANGALAVLGDRQALGFVRGFAKSCGNIFLRSDAIEWLGLSRDKGSLPFLRVAAKHEDRLIRDAAIAALEAVSNNH